MMDAGRFAELRELVRVGGPTSAYRDGLREALDTLAECVTEMDQLKRSHRTELVEALGSPRDQYSAD